MQEPSSNPLSAQGATPAEDGRKRPRLGWYDGAFYFAGLGLCFLWVMPGVPAKLMGVLCVVISALFVRKIIRAKRGYRKPIVPAAEPYANLQAAMARLHETEDKEHHGRT